MRLNKYIADSGFCSRRAADKLIEDGRVTVNKSLAIIGMEVNESDTVRIDGERVRVKYEYEYYLFNKPKRVICSNYDQFGRATAISYIKSNKRLFTYGRLDYMTEGLILISNDGEVYNHIMHPRKKLYKSYVAKIDKEITDDHLEALGYGVVIEGKRTAPSKVKKISKTEVRVAIYEGKNRQVRKMFETLGYEVKKLTRVRIGELKLGSLAVGSYRKLTDEELQYIKSL